MKHLPGGVGNGITQAEHKGGEESRAGPDQKQG